MLRCWLSTLNNMKTTRYIVLQFYRKNAEIHSYRYSIHVLFSSIRLSFRGFGELNTTAGSGNMQGYKMIANNKRTIQSNKTRQKGFGIKLELRQTRSSFPDKWQPKQRNPEFVSQLTAYELLLLLLLIIYINNPQIKENNTQIWNEFTWEKIY